MGREVFGGIEIEVKQGVRSPEEVAEASQKESLRAMQARNDANAELIDANEQSDGDKWFFESATDWLYTQISDFTKPSSVKDKKREKAENARLKEEEIRLKEEEARLKEAKRRREETVNRLKEATAILKEKVISNPKS